MLAMVLQDHEDLAGMVYDMRVKALREDAPEDLAEMVYDIRLKALREKRIEVVLLIILTKQPYLTRSSGFNF